MSKVFEKYKDSREDAILVEGMEKYCIDLEVDPTDVVMLVMAYKMNATKMCEFKRDSFVSFWSKAKCEDISSMKAYIPKLRESLANGPEFEKIYKFAFDFGRESNQKTLPLDIALAFWDLLIKDKYSAYPVWCEFLQKNYGKSISKDTWVLFLEFINTVPTDLSSYDSDGTCNT